MLVRLLNRSTSGATAVSRAPAVKVATNSANAKIAKNLKNKATICMSRNKYFSTRTHHNHGPADAQSEFTPPAEQPTQAQPSAPDSVIDDDDAPGGVPLIVEADSASLKVILETVKIIPLVICFYVAFVCPSI
jgi:hypothetical protein